MQCESTLQVETQGNPHSHFSTTPSFRKLLLPATGILAISRRQLLLYQASLRRYEHSGNSSGFFQRRRFSQFVQSQTSTTYIISSCSNAQNNQDNKKLPRTVRGMFSNTFEHVAGPIFGNIGAQLLLKKSNSSSPEVLAGHLHINQSRLPIPTY